MKSLLIVSVFLLVAVSVSAISLNYWKDQKDRFDRDAPKPFYSQNSTLIDDTMTKRADDSRDSYEQKLRETLSKYNVSGEEWRTHRGNAWIYKWEIIKEMSKWQMENN